MKRKMYRQGDVLLLPIESIPENTQKINDKILAFGEATGHKHQLTGATVQVFQDSNSNKFIEAGQGTVLVHDEHKPLDIEQGKYQVIIQREYNPTGNRNIAD